jgi:fructosamine-3-kinase
VADVIEAKTGLTVEEVNSIGSSGWSSQMIYKTKEGTSFFVKTSRKTADDMFRGEALGLQAIHGVPRSMVSSTIKDLTSDA